MSTFVLVTVLAVALLSPETTVAQQEEPSPVSGPRRLEFPFLNQLEQNPFLKPFTSHLNNVGSFLTGGSRSKSDLEGERGASSYKAPPTTTTTLSPLEQLSKTIVSPISELPATKLIVNGPVKAFNTMLSNMSQGGASPVEQATKGFAKATEVTGKVIDNFSGPTRDNSKAKPENEEAYYDFGPNEPEPFQYRRPKYFSRNCQFRVACQVGKALKPPFTQEFYNNLVKNKFFQDLQNRYTRALTYGTVYGDCERYYCLFVQVLGGPDKFAKGIADLVNRIANPDLYDGISD